MQHIGFQKQKAQKSIFSCNVYKTNHEARLTFPILRTGTLKSKSYSGSSLWNEPQILYVNEKIVNAPERSETSQIGKEISTQTSKTIIELAKMDKGLMSPDSLQCSPRCAPEYSGPSSNLYQVHSSMENNCAISLANYQISECSMEPSRDDCDCGTTLKETCSNLNCLQLLPEGDDKPLTRKFLEKARQRSVIKQPSHTANKISKSQTSAVKSKSFVERYPPEAYEHPNFIREYEEPFRLQICTKPRLSKPSSKSMDLPDNSFKSRRSSTLYNHHHQTNFMCPTTSSQIKSKLAEIKSVCDLIPPMRRGRSTSPKPCADSRRFECSRKIPYIDQSKSDVSSATTIVNITRNPELFSKRSEDILLSERSPSESQIPPFTEIEPPRETVSTDYAVSTAVTKLKDPDWRVALRGLADIVELCRFVDLEHVYEHMININQRLIELLRSPRSHVCRTACQAAGHLFEYVKDTRKPEFDDIVDLLLFKTADANKFIRQDANLALDCMVTHISPYNSIRALSARGPLHKNHLVRSATARLMVCAVVIAGPDSILNPNNNECTRKRVISNMAKFLEDKNLETRKFAERLYKIMCKESRFDVFLKKYVDRDKLAKIKATLKLIHKK